MRRTRVGARALSTCPRAPNDAYARGSATAPAQESGAAARANGIHVLFAAKSFPDPAVRALPPLFAEVLPMRCKHDVVSESLRQFDFFRAIHSALSVLNRNETAHLSQDKHWDDEEPLASLIR